MNGIISSFKSYVTHVWQDPKNEILKAKDALVNQVALDTFVKCFVFTGCVIFKLNICIYAFVGGFILADAVHNLAKRVNNVFAAEKGTLEKITLYGAGGFIALLGLASSFVLVSLYYSANLGSEISRKYNPKSSRENNIDKLKNDFNKNPSIP